MLNGPLSGAQIVLLVLSLVAALAGFAHGYWYSGDRSKLNLLCLAFALFLLAILAPVVIK